MVLENYKIKQHVVNQLNIKNVGKIHFDKQGDDLHITTHDNVYNKHNILAYLDHSKMKLEDEIILKNYNIKGKVLSYLNEEHKREITFIKENNDLHIKLINGYIENFTPKKVTEYLKYVEEAVVTKCKSHFIHNVNKNRLALLNKLIDDSK